MHWYVLAFERYFDFSGRSRRKEYWMFVLVNMLLGFGLMIGDALLGLFSVRLGLGVFGALYSVVALIPSWAVAVRRLHDTDHSGWWFLAPFAAGATGGVSAAIAIPMGADALGMILVLPALLAMLALSITIFVFTIRDGTPGPNRYGPDPKGR